MTEQSPTVDFMVRLRKIDKSGLTARDIVALWAIKKDPGMMGRELALKIGLDSRSKIQLGIDRLIRHGFIEDRRTKIGSLTPNDLYILPDGDSFLSEIVPV